MRKLVNILDDVKNGTISVELAEQQVLNLFDDLPDEFYDKFEKRKVEECGGKVLGNINEQYFYSRGFLATLETLREYLK